jgi:hypothetical protein
MHHAGVQSMRRAVQSALRQVSTTCDKDAQACAEVGRLQMVVSDMQSAINAEEKELHMRERAHALGKQDVHAKVRSECASRWGHIQTECQFAGSPLHCCHWSNATSLPVAPLTPRLHRCETITLKRNALTGPVATRRRQRSVACVSNLQQGGVNTPRIRIQQAGPTKDASLFRSSSSSSS